MKLKWRLGRILAFTFALCAVAIVCAPAIAAGSSPSASASMWTAGDGQETHG